MNARVSGHEVDAYWPEHALVVELDSLKFHKTRAVLEDLRALVDFRPPDSS